MEAAIASINGAAIVQIWELMFIEAVSLNVYVPAARALLVIRLEVITGVSVVLKLTDDSVVVSLVKVSVNVPEIPPPRTKDVP